MVVSVELLAMGLLNLLFCVGLLGNAGVLWAVLGYKASRDKAVNLLLASLV
jgi:hypothetical protein